MGIGKNAKRTPRPSPHASHRNGHEGRSSACHAAMARVSFAFNAGRWACSKHQGASARIGLRGFPFALAPVGRQGSVGAHCGWLNEIFGGLPTGAGIARIGAGPLATAEPNGRVQSAGTSILGRTHSTSGASIGSNRMEESAIDQIPDAKGNMPRLVDHAAGREIIIARDGRRAA